VLRHHGQPDHKGNNLRADAHEIFFDPLVGPAMKSLKASQRFMRKMGMNGVERVGHRQVSVYGRNGFARCRQTDNDADLLASQVQSVRPVLSLFWLIGTPAGRKISPTRVIVASFIVAAAGVAVWTASKTTLLAHADEVRESPKQVRSSPHESSGKLPKG
jgi:hypothetical protein